MQETNYDSLDSEAGLTWRRVKMADGLDKLRAESVFSNIGNDSGWFIDNESLTEQANGEYRVVWEQTKERNTNEYITVQFIAGNGNQQETEVVLWRWLSESNADQVVADAKTHSADMTGAYPPAPANHKQSSAKKTPNNNGSYDVTRVTFIPNNSGTAIWPEIQDKPYSNYLVYASGFDKSSQLQKYTVRLLVTEYFNSVDEAWDNISVSPTNAYLQPFPSVRRIGDRKYSTTIYYRLTNGTPATIQALNGNEPYEVYNEKWVVPIWLN